MLAIDLLHDWLSLRLVPEMNRARFYALFQRFATPDAVFGSSVREIVTIRGFNAELAAAVMASHATDRGRRHMDQMGRAGVRAVTRDCPDYPFNLAQSSLAPPLLFVKGTLAPEDKYSIALVGSRHATTYGRSVARELAGGLARYGLTIVSGFARGIDGEAHHAAIKAGGRTLGVLGNGLDVCYPSEHRGLAEEVVSNGALISEYPLGTSPERFNFPERNHVIATLSLGTIVVEAAEKSGSLITSRLALDENRFVFAVPGDITRNNSRGANALIQSGAHLVQRAQDVLVEMKDVLRGYLDVDALTAVQAKAATAVSPAPEPAGVLVDNGDRRARAKHDWVDAISDLDPQELEQVAARINLGGDAQISSAPPPAANIAPLANRAAPKAALAAALAASQLPDVSNAGTESMGPKPARPASDPVAPGSLTEQEQFIVSLLHHEAMVFDELADRAFGQGIDVPRLTSLLMKLELKKVIRQMPGRYYVLFV